MTEYSKVLRGTFTSTGVNKPVYLPMKPDSFKIWNKTAWAGTTANDVFNAIGFAEDANGTAYAEIIVGAAATVNYKLTSGGFTFFQAGQPTFGAVKTMSGSFVTQANPANIEITSHGYQTGDVVWVYGTTGMLQIAGIPYTVTRVDANNFTIPVNSSGFAAAATAGFVKQFLYPDLYIPELCFITNISQAANAVITTNINHAFVVGQEVSFILPSGWGMTEINGLKGTVLSVTSGSITVDIDSSGFTAFAYPTSATAAAGITFPQVFAIGDQNTGYSLNSSGNVPYLGITNGVIGIPGSFAANTRQGVIVGTGDGTRVMHATNDVVAWEAVFPDAVQLNV